MGTSRSTTLPTITTYMQAAIPSDERLDPDIAPVVRSLQASGIETFESCQGGVGHAFPEPTVRFHGHGTEGFRAFAAASSAGFTVAELRKTWDAIDGELVGPWWELVVDPPGTDEPQSTTDDAD